VETADGTVEWGPANGWTAMVDGTQLARACIKAYAENAYYCTAWH
jgi:hypothetical protein